MNRYDIAGAGFPADNETWMFIQTMITELGQLALLGGQDYILSGCQESGGNITDGWMVLNGQIVPFLQTPIGPTVTVIESVESVTYLEDLNPADGQGDTKDTYFRQTALITDVPGVYSIPWANLERVEDILSVQKAKVPVGTIVMWAGAINDLPEGWFLCDGTNETPNLSGKFIVGYDFLDSDYDEIGKQGGQEEVTLTVGQMPQHSHNGTAAASGNHSHGIQFRVDNIGSGDGINLNQDNANSDEGLQTFNTQSAGLHSHTVTTNNVGDNEAHENRPPYYTLAYIQFKG
ncbi:MAG: hypothetical protein AAF717_00415 [Bacteroidota bacterium]